MVDVFQPKNVKVSVSFKLFWPLSPVHEVASMALLGEQSDTTDKVKSMVSIGLTNGGFKVVTSKVILKLYGNAVI